MSSIYHLLIPNSKMSFTMQMEIKLSLISCLPKSLASWREPHITTNTNSGPLLRWTDAIDMSKLQHHCIDSSIIVLTPPFHWHHHSFIASNCLHSADTTILTDSSSIWCHLSPGATCHPGPPVTWGHKSTSRNIEQTYIETSFCQLFTRSRDIWDINWIREGHSLL